MGGLFILKEKGYNCLVQILFLVLRDYEICGVIWFFTKYLSEEHKNDNILYLLISIVEIQQTNDYSVIAKTK